MSQHLKVTIAKPLSEVRISCENIPQEQRQNPAGDFAISALENHRSVPSFHEDKNYEPAPTTGDSVSVERRSQLEFQ